MKPIFSLLTLFLFYNATIAQTTAIPDSNFEQALIDYGYDSGGLDGVVLTGNIDTVTQIILFNLSIIDLSGIEDFAALTYLYCSDNQLTTLDISQNSALTYLNCMSNQLATLDLSQNITLTDLNCSGNQLETLDLSQNTALTDLDYAGNQVTTLDISQNTGLTYLNCQNNQITTLDVSQNTALAYLVCQNNSLTTLNVSQNTALTKLYCYNNQLNNLDVSQNTALTTLSCFSNQLTNLDVSQNGALTDLQCLNNQLTTLDMTQNTALTVLNCSNNQLTCLNVKNGTNINVNNFYPINNPNLTCIEVDDVAYATTNWTSIDAQTSFSTNCNNACSNNTVGLEENKSLNVSTYPNPTNGNFTIDIGKVKQDVIATLTNSLGQVVLTRNYTSTNFINLDIDAPIGIYFLQIENDGEVITKKIIKK